MNDEWVFMGAIAFAVAVFFGVLYVGITEESAMAQACVQGGQQWIDGNCLRVAP